jgi:uncharacterized protein
MKNNFFKPLSFVIVLALSTAAYSASFDCQKAKSINEKLICQDEDLSKLDDELSVIYKSAISKSKTPKYLIANQRSAWKQREKECSSKSCLLYWFAQRKAFFDATTPTPLKTTKQNVPEQPSKNAEESFPNNVKTTWSYKPFAILSSKLGNEMSDVSIANRFLCKSPAETLQESMDLLQNYDLVDTSRTDGTLTTTSFRGIQEGKKVTISLAVDEQSRPRIVRYILVDGMPALNCH